jgi:RND family efflux transporter MFP subunit
VTRSRPGSVAKWLLASLVLVLGIAAVGYYYVHHFSADEVADAGTSGDGVEENGTTSEIHVEVIKPTLGEMDRVTVQIGTVQSYELVNLYSRVPGFLERQTVDIGDRVKKGQVLAVIDVPELETELERRSAGLEQADARVTQMEARVWSAEADAKAVRATQVQAEANYRSAGATLRYREAQYKRIKALFATESIEEKLVDEKFELRDAAVEAESAAKAAIETTKAKGTASEAKIHGAEADLLEAKAEVRVAKAELAKAKAMLGFATIRAPFDGVVTQRNFFAKDFIRAADTSASMPLLRVERTDKVRVVVQIPDRDSPYADVGDPATVEIDALPGRRYKGTISRIADSEDQQTRLMRVEIDLPNPRGRIHQGMFGRTTILLDRLKTPSIYSSCLVGKSKEGKGFVYVVRDGHVHLTPVDIGQDNGVRVGILHGLTGKERVVRRPPSTLSDGAEVVVSEVPVAKPAEH